MIRKYKLTVYSADLTIGEGSCFSSADAWIELNKLSENICNCDLNHFSDCLCKKLRSGEAEKSASVFIAYTCLYKFQGRP